MGISNLEARIKKLENTSNNEFGATAGSIFYPIRKLMLTEEKSHDEDGVAFPVLVATWDKPAGVIFPESIRLIHNGTTVSLAGTATSYRMAGYAVGNTVTVNVTAIYIQGASSTVTAVKTITGNTTPPSVPTNLTVAGGFRTLTLRWENPTAEDFSHIEIWESVSAPNLATAERIAQAYGTEFVRSNCGVVETRWYWIRALDTHGNYSDFTSPASGTTTAIAMEDVPDGTIAESMLISELASEINKIPAIEVDLDAVESRVSSAESELYAYIDDGLNAEAGERTLLAARVTGNTSAIQSEQTTRANADSAMASQITTLISDVGDNTAAIQVIEDVRSGTVDVFRQATAPTTGMTAGDLWVNNSGVVYRYEGGAWVSKAGSTVYDLLKTAIAQYVVKTQTASGDGKLKIAGFGLYNDSTTGSEFAVLADRFYVYGQKSDGSSYSNIQVFTVDTTTTPPTVGINGNLIVDGSIVGEKIYSGAKIQLGDGGEFITGANSIVQMASGVITLDSVNGTIQVKDPANVTTGDYVKIDTGDITTYKYLGGAYYPMKSLRKMTAGSNIPNNTAVTIPGRFPSQPEIFVSPCNLQTYDASPYGNQDQSLFLQATNINYNSTTGVCTFIPRAELRVAAGSGNLGVISSNSTSTGVATSSSYPVVLSFSPVSVALGSKTIPANVSTVNINAKIYAQAMHNDSRGTTFAYCLVPHVIDYVIYAQIDGTNYVVGSGAINRQTSLIDISSEPAALYINKNITLTVNTVTSKTIIIWASIAPRSEVRSLTYTLGNEDNPISVTPYNKAWLACSGISYVLASANVIATGTLNYMAIAE